MGVHLPLGLPAHPALPCRPARLPLGVHRLRRHRLAPDGGDRDVRAGARHQAAAAALGGRGHRPGQGGARRRGAVRRGVGERFGPFPPPHRRRLPRVPAAAGGGQRHGLRRPAAAGGAAAAHLRGRAHRLPAAVPPHPGRRVPGHQPGPERAGGPVGQGPRQRLRGGRRRPVGLRLPGRRHAQHPHLRGGLRPHDHGGARAELPLDPDHPRRRQRGHRQQPGPPTQAALHRGGSGRADPPLPGRGRARRGPVGGRRDPAAPAGRGPLLRRGGRLLPHQRPEPGGRGGAGAGRPSPTR